MTNFIINKHNHYFMLSNEVAKMLDVSKLHDCKTFETMESFYDAVHEIFPDIDDVNVLMGSYIELWYDDEDDDVKGDHSTIDFLTFDIDTLAEDLSEFKA